MMGDPDHRVTPKHRSRAALVYVRQSSEKQVRMNLESTRIQVGLREKAIALGWSQPVVIDDDLGVSASGYAHRPGFKELITRITMKQAGIILCFDASRLSRNSKDWAQLFELCSYFDTLIADLDQVYDLSQPNDRLVLGIKGTISEMELGVLRNRMRSGMEAKAARGELRLPLPAGYVHDDEYRILFDPDRRVQAAIRLMFDQFDRVTSIRQLALWYRDTGTRFPVRKDSWNPKTVWQVPTSQTLRKLLVHPIYAGAYVWGRRPTGVDYVDGRLVKRVQAIRSLDECPVCIRDHHPAYVSWDRIMANVTRLSENKARWKMNDNQGAIREGLALLPGLLRCRTCGSRLYVNYKKTGALYSCDGGHAKGSRRCMSFGATEIDRRVGEELLRALAPHSVKAAIAAREQSEEEVTQRLTGLRLSVEAAQYEADRAFKQYDLVEPENRLVAGTLETLLNEKLALLKEAKERLAEAEEEDRHLTDEQRQRLEALAADFPDVWNHPQADPKVRKSLLRTVVREILVELKAEEKQLEVTIHWRGGVHTQFRVKKYDRRRGAAADPDLIEMVGKLAADGITDADSARVLNMHGTTTPGGLPWTVARVTNFRGTHRIRCGKRPSSEEYLTMSEAASHLGISRNGLLGLERIGALSRNQVMEFAPWRVERTELDSERVQALVRTLKTEGRLPKGGCPEGQLSLLDDE
jgi:DNA invertase Pin-like site-specific DNA recombinase